jgi:hypothetical protein
MFPIFELNKRNETSIGLDFRASLGSIQTRDVTTGQALATKIRRQTIDALLLHRNTQRMRKPPVILQINQNTDRARSRTHPSEEPTNRTTNGNVNRAGITVRHERRDLLCSGLSLTLVMRI